MISDDRSFSGYFCFSGPSVDQGKINVGKIGRSLVALERLFNQYAHKICKLEKGNLIDIKVQALERGSTTVQIVLEQVLPAVHPVVASGSWYLLAKAIGVTEFGKQFFGTLANQLVLKMFSKGERLNEGQPFADGQRIYVKLVNAEGHQKIVLLEDWQNYKMLYPDSRGLVQLDPGEKFTVGYKISGEKNDLATVKYEEKQYFDTDLERSTEEKANDPFDDINAFDCKLIGKFVDYHGLAYRYPFSFQVRKHQEDIGKHKILCAVENHDISKIINYLKPENSINLCISGKATRDFDGKIDKIKIQWFSEDINYNPAQTDIL